MGGRGGFGLVILLIAVVNIEAQKKPSINIHSKCLGNVMRLDIGPLGGNLLEVSVVFNNSSILLTPSLASQCGFSARIDQLGNIVIFASLQNCFAQNVADEAFTTRLNLRLHGNQVAEDELYQVVETCRYTAWASREIVCDRNYMEVSVKRTAENYYALPDHPISSIKKFGASQQAAEKQPMDAEFKIKTITFFTPEEKIMPLTEAHRRGYGISNTPTRLVLRSPLTSPETYIQNVAGVPMSVLKTSIVFEKKLATQIHAGAACPILDGSVFFTPDSISWFLPRRIEPLTSSGQFQLLEVHMGVDGQRLNVAEMAARHYSLSVNNVYILAKIPVGAVGGHFKSHVWDGQYLTTYTIELMLELLWTENAAYKDTRYKVFLPITTPLLSQSPQVTDNTVPEERVFKVQLGPFCSDVALMNITISSEVLSVADCSARGLKVLEHMSPKSCSKVFTLEIPFKDRGVLKMQEEMEITVYTLQLTFGLLVLPEYAPFSHTASLEARLENKVPPSVAGGCDYQYFYVLVRYGTHGFNFQTLVGRRLLTSLLAKEYGLMDNGTHFSFSVPFSAVDVMVEAVEASSIRSRLDVSLRTPATNKNIKEFSVACNFFPRLTECFSNGTITALAMKLESVPSLKPSRLTLRDPTCGPSHSDDHYAYFVFSGNSCGTTRKFLPNMMLYENDISLPDAMKRVSKTDEPEYELKVACYFDINTNHAVAFNNRPRRSEPYAENAIGELKVEIKLALDASYSTFHRVEADPIAKYLQQPLYFEVELIKSRNPEVSLELVDCWATLEDDRTSLPKRDLIINGCVNPRDPYQVIFHPVLPDARVQYPSNFKRFEIPMFAFAKDQDNLSLQVFVHCDVVICDASYPVGRACNVQCSNQDEGMKGQKRSVSDGHRIEQVSSGPILMS